MNKSNSRIDVPSVQLHIINTLQILFISVAISVPHRLFHIPSSFIDIDYFVPRRLGESKPRLTASSGWHFIETFLAFARVSAKLEMITPYVNTGYRRKKERKEPQVGDAIIDFRMPRIHSVMQIHNGISNHQRESVPLLCKFSSAKN